MIQPLKARRELLTKLSTYELHPNGDSREFTPPAKYQLEGFTLISSLWTIAILVSPGYFLDEVERRN